MEYNISYKEESIPVPLSGFIVRLADKIISQILWAIRELRGGVGE